MIYFFMFKLTFKNEKFQKKLKLKYNFDEKIEPDTLIIDYKGSSNNVETKFTYSDDVLRNYVDSALRSIGKKHLDKNTQIKIVLKL